MSGLLGAAGNALGNPSDDREKAQIYNTGITVKTKRNSPEEYFEDLFSNEPPTYVPGYLQREMMSFHLPTIGIVEMYINPQNFTITSKKQITEVRTKGGYVMQYWGEMLDEIRLAGTTGSSGIEGINILRDIYRSEHKTFSSVSNTLATQLGGGINALLANSTSSSSFGREIGKWLNLSGTTRPTLASLAAGVSLIFQGVVYKGYFKGFTVSEKAEMPGIFDYDMSFFSFARRGLRTNFMPWHRSPRIGPANSDRFTPNYQSVANAQKTDKPINQLLEK